MNLPSLEADHLERIRSAIYDDFSLSTLARWITERTFLGGRPFSFKDHEFQLRILESEASSVVVKKCSQVGISEFAVRRTLAIADTLPDIHVLYTLPSAKFSGQFARTRIDPVIEGSPYLKSRVNPEFNSAEIKQIGSSFIYIKGTIGQSAAISIPASLLVHDEVDFSDQTVLTSYQSRLTHSAYKLEFNLSTPTVSDYGIDALMKSSKRHFQFVTCSHCGERFLPDYFQHVVIPGWNRPLEEIDKEVINSIRWEEARLACPACGKSPNLSPAFREWVVENPSTRSRSDGFQVSPFDAPAVISVPYLVHASTKYKRYADFINFNLGQCAEDSDNSFSEAELKKLRVPQVPRLSRYVVGCDTGLASHVVVAGQVPDGTLVLLPQPRIALSDFYASWAQLHREFLITRGVIDSQPYADLVLELQRTNPYLFASVYKTGRAKGVEVFSVQAKEEDDEGFKNPLKLVNVVRNTAFDVLMGLIRTGRVVVCAQDDVFELWVKHLTDMRRLQKEDANGEIYYQWEKSAQGSDHYHHATLYAYVASQMMDMGAPSLPMPFAVRTFRTKTQV